MRLCIFADLRSPIAVAWVEQLVAAKLEVHVISSYPVSTWPTGVASTHEVAISMSRVLTRPAIKRYVGGASEASHLPTEGTPGTRRFISGWVKRYLSSAAYRLLPWIGPIEARWHARTLARILRDVQPDALHALRITYEGVLAGDAARAAGVPLIVSVWGNDFTLYARSSRVTAHAIRETLQNARALMADCQRDARLAKSLGLAAAVPTLVVPGNGGIRPDVFFRGPALDSARARWGIPHDRTVIINPRNFRPHSVRTNELFQAIPKVLSEFGSAFIVCVGMAGNPVAESWVQRAGIGDSVRLLPKVSRAEMADLFRIAAVSVSPSEHDGTPNTLLEAMACGCFPVAGDIESIREWVQSGSNGLLCDPTQPESIASSLLTALRSPELRSAAAAKNARIINDRATTAAVLPAVLNLYRSLQLS